MAEQTEIGSDRARNNFNLMRLIAASLVLVSHSFSLSGHGPEPLDTLSGNQTSLGHLCVDVFFVISGFLITESYVRRPSPTSFLLSRALRIYPGLVVALSITAFAIGPVLSTLSVSQYFSTLASFRFVVKNLIFDTEYILPGMFRGNPYPLAVNGSLWTLQPEVICYLSVLFLGSLPIAKRFGALLALGILVLLFFIVPVSLKNYIGFGAAFAGGACMFLWRPALNGVVAAACATACLASMFIGGFVPICAIAGAYLVVYLGCARRLLLPDLTMHFGDASYGIYIWAFPVQQIVAAFTGSHFSWWENTLAAAPITIILALGSYWFIERPALLAKGRALRYLHSRHLTSRQPAKPGTE